MNDSINIVVAGATGYVGLELIKILSTHPKANIKYLCAQKSIGKSIYSFNKKIKKKNLPKISSIKKVKWKNIDLIFTALPNGEAQKIAKKINSNIKLIDLSGDFRIKNPLVYKKWYGKKHICTNLIKKSIYSISEFNKKKLNQFKIIACPGCYPTSVQIPLIPLIENKLINLDNIIIDSKSGFSGAGKNLKKKFYFKNIYQSVSAYALGFHKHMPEIEQELSKVAKRKIHVSFTPHLIPMFRGILSTIYLQTRGSITAKKLHLALKKYHKNNFFVKVAKFNSTLGTGEVMNTNFCKISICENRSKNKVIIISVIDNLIKGASGQAVQNMNLAFGFRETLGLK